MKDSFNREISYLRISVTDRCNLRCRYCMPENGICKLSHDDILSLEDMAEIAKAAAGLGIKKIRLTGGEPLTRKGIGWLCREIKQIQGIEELALTSNAVLLPGMSDELREAGVDRLNISLDTLKPEKYEEITRGGKLSDALRGIDTALSAGFKKIKINTVLIGGFNDDEIPELAHFAAERNTDLRFIELMPMPFIDMPKESYAENSLVLERLPGLKELPCDGVARMYSMGNSKGRIGLISPLSCSFCSECNRIRLTADGYLKPCLHSTDEIPVKGLHGKELETAIISAINAKPKEHLKLDSDNPSLSKREMGKIGG